jgi:hypothetical protein
MCYLVALGIVAMITGCSGYFLYLFLRNGKLLPVGRCFSNEKFFLYSNDFIANAIPGYSIAHLFFFEYRSIFSSRNNSQVGYLADAIA